MTANESSASGATSLSSASSCIAASAAAFASAVAPPPGPALASSALGKRHAALLATVSRAVDGAVGRRGGRGGARGSSLPFAPEGVPAPAEVASAVAALTTAQNHSSSSSFSLALALPPTDLAGSGDPVRLIVARSTLLPPPARAATFDLILTNVSQSGDDLVGAVVRLELSGAAVAAASSSPDDGVNDERSSGSAGSSGGLIQPIPRLSPGASFSWRASASLAGPGAATLRARLVLRLPASALAVAAATGNFEEPGCLRLAGELSWGPADWVKRFGGGGGSSSSSAAIAPPTRSLSTAAADFFASWAGTPSSPALCWRGSSTRAGVSAGPALLGALTRGGGLALDWLAPLPASSGFAAALRGSCAAGLWSPSSAAAVAGGAATLAAPPPPVLIFVTARLVVGAAGGGAANSSAPAPSRPLPRLDVRCELRTFDAAAAAAVAANAGAFFVSLAAAAAASNSNGNNGSRESELLGCSSLAHGGGAPPRPPAARASGVGAALAEAFAETVSFDDVGGIGGEKRQQAAAVAAGQEFWRRSLAARAASV